MLQIKKDDNNELSAKQSEDFSKIRSYFKTWEEQFENIKIWTIENGKLPLRTTQKEFHSWLLSQRSVFQNGNLTEEQIKKLESIDFELIPKGNERKRDRWLEMYDNLVAFQNENPDSWPKFGADGLEGQLYNWCQANRQAQAGTHSGGKRKPLKQWKVDKLNELGFHWAKSDVNNEEWERNFNEFKKHIDSNGNLSLPSMINGKHNLLYRWFFNQRIAFEKNKVPTDRLLKFKEVGINLNEFNNKTTRNGFTKWANKARKIAEFISENGHYPKAGTDKTQNNLYQSLARTKRALKNNELSEEQIELLNELNIEL